MLSGTTPYSYRLQASFSYRALSLYFRFLQSVVTAACNRNGGNGIFKLVVDQKQRTVLGAQALCNYASEFIVAVGAFIELGLTLEEIKEVVFPHPTVCEIIREAVFQA